MQIRYCTKCLYPETKPEIRFDEFGVCSACLNYEARQAIDWQGRADAFDQFVRRDGSRPPWVIVPVSGGKDSLAQVLKCLDMGYQVLAVNARTDMLSDLGRRNLDNIGRLCDVVEFHPNDAVRHRIMRLALYEVGDWSWPEHVLIHTVPFKAALRWKIPTIVFGELSQDEYGAGPRGSEAMQRMTRRYIEEFAGLLGLRVEDVRDMIGLTSADMEMYTFPRTADLENAGVQATWLGQHFPWSGFDNYQTAKAAGFEEFTGHVEGSLFGYENLDNHATGGRDYIRYLKYGYGRATDIASNHIRRGAISRADAIDLVRAHDGQFPASYLGKPLVDILATLSLSVDEFVDVCDRYTNKKLFQLNLASLRPVPLFEIR
jgi:N-acetyl sugar amidotransferase